jgi:hypothetical protein
MACSREFSSVSDALLHARLRLSAASAEYEGNPSPDIRANVEARFAAALISPPPRPFGIAIRSALIAATAATGRRCRHCSYCCYCPDL